MSENMGASDKSDRALSATPTEPEGSAHSGDAPLREAVKRALSPAFQWALSRMHGAPSERLYWFGLRDDAPQRVADELFKAGYVLTKLGDQFEATVTRREGRAFEQIVRVIMDVKAGTIGVEKSVPLQFVRDKQFLRDHLPRQLAAALLRHREPELAARIAAVIAREG